MYMLVFYMTVAHPMDWRHRSSFSIRLEADVGTRCFRANCISERRLPFSRPRYTELNVPSPILDRTSNSSLTRGTFSSRVWTASSGWSRIQGSRIQSSHFVQGLLQCNPLHLISTYKSIIISLYTT